ncbi:hypothetical protein TRIUR3_13232 [Triticum urartu]|uniref:F-box domain-containing protein n=1 Tax=Triticum urartu TaxID=4572 RepID=M8AFN7_TRIUA|nr:hypothetical protein TRIUR3_13232 [Triticum urartu]
MPRDILLDVLRRLPNRAVAESWRVSCTWRAAVDDSAVLLARFNRIFPPRAFLGIFTNNCTTVPGINTSGKHGTTDRSSFFARTGKPPHTTFDDELVFRHPPFKHDWASVLDHCNGLLLLRQDGPRLYYVRNPMTVRCARLPALPTLYFWSIFLAFDPAVSRHHEVFLFPRTMTQLRPMKEAVRSRVEAQELLRGLFEEDQPYEEEGKKEQCEVEQTHELVVEDQPKDEVLSLMVFSSRTNRWESREFVPGSYCTSQHLYDMLPLHENYNQIWKSAVYWRGSLYVHCGNNILMILRNSQVTYDMVQLPRIPCDEEEHRGTLPTRSVLASYEKGIHYVTLDMFQLQVWKLTEPVDGQLGWTLTHEDNLSLFGHQIKLPSQVIKQMAQWELVESSEAKVSLFEPLGSQSKEEDEDEEEQAKSGSEYLWDSDEDNFIDLDEGVTDRPVPLEYWWYCRIIGMHPHKDVLLLHMNGRAMAYHLNTSRMQHLGKGLVKKVGRRNGVECAFPYRPCYVDALPVGKMSQ